MENCQARSVSTWPVASPITALCREDLPVQNLTTLDLGMQTKQLSFEFAFNRASVIGTEAWFENIWISEITTTNSNYYIVKYRDDSQWNV